MLGISTYEGKNGTIKWGLNHHSSLWEQTSLLYRKQNSVPGCDSEAEVLWLSPVPRVCWMKVWEVWETGG